MIRIVRPDDIPDILVQDGQAKNGKNCTAYTKNPGTYSVRKASFDFDSKVYGHDEVKTTLRAAQYDKCCYCEQDQSGQYGEIEHFRPKTAYQLKKRKRLIYPGYYWLCFKWNNLLFACEKCNRTYKKNLFPLSNEAERAKKHTDDLNKENPLLIDPVTIDPRDHIYFQDNLVYSDTPEGKATITICGLDREDLNNARKKLLKNLNLCILVWEDRDTIPQSTVEKAIAYLKDAQHPSAPFSATAIDYLSIFHFDE